MEMEIITEIALRAVSKASEMGVRVRRTDVIMAVTLVHAERPLRLEELKDADDFNFVHDVFGILQNIDRLTGELQNCFVPRFSR